MLRPAVPAQHGDESGHCCSRVKKKLISDMLVTKISLGKIGPVYALLGPQNLEIACSQTDPFQVHVGKSAGALPAKRALISK